MKSWQLLLLLALHGPACAGDVKAGREAAAKCDVCHGADGISTHVEAPSLAGQNEQYLVKELLAYKTGARQNNMMSIIAPALSQKQIEDLAAFYAAIEIKVVKVPGG